MGAKRGSRFHRGREGWYICIVYKGETGDTKAEKQEWKEISRLYDGPAIIVIDC